MVLPKSDDDPDELDNIGGTDTDNDNKNPFSDGDDGDAGEKSANA